MRFLYILLLVFVVSCTPTKKETLNVSYGEENHIKGNTLILGNIKKSDSIPSDLFTDVKIISLKGVKKVGDWANIRVKLFKNSIYILKDFEPNFYQFDSLGNLKFQFPFNAYTTHDNVTRNFSDFIISDNENINFLTDHASILTFNKNKLLGSKTINFWGQDFETTTNKEYVFYTGYVNDDYGHPNHITIMDKELVGQTKHLLVDTLESSAAMKIGASMHHLFKSDQQINMVKDQDNYIYKYPDFKNPYYKVDFVGHKIDYLDVSGESMSSPVFSHYAKLKDFWETSTTIYSSYHFNPSPNFFIVNKKNKKILNRSKLNSIDHCLLATIQTVYNDYFISVLEPELISSLKQLKKNHRGFLKDYALPVYSSKTPLLVMFKLKNF